jgi:hypothetical protein
MSKKGESMASDNQAKKWMPQKDYRDGDKVVRKGFVYVCKEEHTSTYSNSPEAAAGKIWFPIIDYGAQLIRGKAPKPLGPVEIALFTEDESIVMRWMLSQYYAMCTDPGGGIYEEENQTMCQETIRSIANKMGIDLMNVEYGFVLNLTEEEE